MIPGETKMHNFYIFLNTTWLPAKAHFKLLSMGQPSLMLITVFFLRSKVELNLSPVYQKRLQNKGLF